MKIEEESAEDIVDENDIDKYQENVQEMKEMWEKERKSLIRIQLVRTRTCHKMKAFER